MYLSLYSHPEGVAASDGLQVVYDIEADSAHFGAASVKGAALRWVVTDGPCSDAALSAALSLDCNVSWVMRCDRVDFPPGGVAYRHVHPGPGIRCLLFGGLTVETPEGAHAYGPLQAWFESGPEPVLATASESEASAFVRVMLLPAEWTGKRTIRYVDQADADRPRRQSARIYFDRPVAL